MFVAGVGAAGQQVPAVHFAQLPVDGVAVGCVRRDQPGFVGTHHQLRTVAGLDVSTRAARPSFTSSNAGSTGLRLKR